MLLQRMLIGLGLVLLAVGAYYVYARWQSRHIAERQKHDPILAALKPGRPAVIYFWSEDCAPCLLVQKPALRQLEDDLGGERIQVIPVDAAHEIELARAWGVMSLPTTFVLDAEGVVRHVNHGVARADKLRRQLAA